MYYFERIQHLNPSKQDQLQQFLAQSELTIDQCVTHWVLAYDEDSRLVACGGIAQNILKCIAINSAQRGQGLALSLMSELVNQAYQLGYTQLFIYTKPEYVSLFEACGFYLIMTAEPHVALLENSRQRLTKQCDTWRQYRVEGEKIGAIVMNANPFTLGHRYLIEQALRQCEHLHLFVVSENASQFSYEGRFSLVQQGIADLSNITLHTSSPYLISRATFPDYFLKDKGLVNALHLALDLKIFRQYIVPSLGITHRFVGTEPICAVTREYNRQMHYWLQQAEMTVPKIEVVEIERKQSDEQPISASRVRALLAEQDWTALQALVPATTLHFLQQIETK